MPADEQPKVVFGETKPVRSRSLKVLLTWSAPSRPFKKRSKEFFSTVGTIALLTIIILFFFKEWLGIMVIIAMAFATYVFATIPPEVVEHQVTNRGLASGGKKYPWDQLTRFWFSQKSGHKMLFVEAKQGVTRLLILLLGGTDQAGLKKILLQYLPFDEPEKTWLDKAGLWLSQKFPLE